MTEKKGCALWSALTLAVAVLLLPSAAVAWDPVRELVTPQQALERMDRQLLPIYGSITASLGEIDDPALEAPYLDILQFRAIAGWEVVRIIPFDHCYAQYVATLRVGYALLADSIDSYRADDPVFNTQLSAALFLLGDQATLERGATTCGGAAAPTATPRQVPSPAA